MRLLDRLDERVVPALGQALRGTADTAVAAAAATGRPGRAVARGARRYSVPVAAVALVAVAVLLIVVTGGDDHSSVRPKPSTVVPALAGQRLGPAVGAPVAAYLAAARQRAQQLAALPATQPVTAVVDLTGYLTPQAVASLRRPGLRVREAYARVPAVPNAAIHALAVPVSGDLAAPLAAARTSARAVVARYRAALADETLTPSRRLEAEIAASAASATQAAVDARGLRPSCGCVFALLVTGPVAALRSLAAAPDVRVLDPAPPQTSLRELMVVPLEPQVTGIVPQVQFAGE